MSAVWKSWIELSLVDFKGQLYFTPEDMEIPPGQKQFNCEHCQAAILVPLDLPATSAPCPVCQTITTSPGVEEAVAPAAAQVEVPRSNPRVADQGERIAETRREETKGKAGLLWALAALIGLVLLLGGAFLAKRSRGAAPEKKPLAMGSVSQPQVDAPAGGSPASGAPSGNVREKVLEALGRFLSATTVAEKAKCVIGQDQMIPEMESFYGGSEIEKDDLRVDFFSDWAMDSPDSERGIYLMDFERPKQFKLGTLFRPITDFKTRLRLDTPDLHTSSKALIENFETEAVRALIYLKETNGELLIDWHTYVQTKNRLFRKFVENPVAGQKGVFRVVVGEHVSTIFEEDSSVRNYKIIEPAHNEEDFAVVKVKRDSEVGKLLEQLAWTDVSGKGGSSPSSRKGATVVLRWSDDVKPVLTLSEVLCWEFLGVGGDPSNLTSGN